MIMKRILAVLTALVMALMLCVPATAEEEDRFADWNPDAPALKALIEYVESVTDESSPDYIPPVDRIATFDMDGTLCAELNPTYLEYYLLAWRILKDPSYEPDAEMLCWSSAVCCGTMRWTSPSRTIWTCCTPPTRRKPTPV